jgi:hypothetical protein
VRRAPDYIVACTCPAHRENPPRTAVGSHIYRLVSDEDDRGWRWSCACGASGRWQTQSDSAAFHSWLRHAGLEDRR